MKRTEAEIIALARALDRGGLLAPGDDEHSFLFRPTLLRFVQGEYTEQQVSDEIRRLTGKMH